MSINKKAFKMAYITLMFLALISCHKTSAIVEVYLVEYTDITVYRDGTTSISQQITVNETYPAIALSLFSTHIENVLVVDENRTFLDYEIKDDNITIYTLGAVGVTLEYDTDRLTSKEAGIWTLNLEAHYNLTLYLPAGSTIIYLNDVPTSIRAEDNRTALELSIGTWEISYTLPITPITPTPTPQPTPTATPTASPTPTHSPTPTPSPTPPTSPTTSPSPAPTPSPTPIHTPTPTTTPTMPPSPTPTQTPYPTPTSTPALPLKPNQLLYIALGTAIIAGFAFFFYSYSKKRYPNAEEILKSHPDLRREDEEVIRFIDERGGRVFESDIRERFKEIPRTSLWRLIRRLERMEIVKVRKVGIQNHVEFRKK